MVVVGVDLKRQVCVPNSDFLAHRCCAAGGDIEATSPIKQMMHPVTKKNMKRGIIVDVRVGMTISPTRFEFICLVAFLVVSYQRLVEIVLCGSVR